ncbi:uncharacterized protein [Palaemon carinicauda]|uniref:uncharacterized protein n=1 Tax=Palaemon carinicauda TaxID=392227 RepID=UPI0035B5B54D
MKISSAHDPNLGLVQSLGITLEKFPVGNIRGLYPKAAQSKISFIRELACEEDFMFIALTETHLSEGIMEPEIHIRNYTSFWTDRKGRTHGGTIIYLRDDIAPNSIPLLSYSDGQIELQAIQIQQHNMVIINCYRPPGSCSRNFSGAMEALSRLLDSLPVPTPDVILTGDFNFPFLKWPEGTQTGSTLADKSQAELLLSITNSSFLIQMVSIPTRGNNILDLFFTNNRDAINYVSAERTIFSDHNLLKIHTTYNKSHSPEMATPTEKNPFSKINFFSSQVNWDLLNAQLQCTDWVSELHVGNPEVMLNDFLQTILRACEGNVPTRKLPATRRSQIPRDRKVIMRLRANLNRQMQTTKSATRKNSLQAKISHIENELEDSHEKQRDWEETQAVCNIKAIPKFFFKYCKKFSKIQVKVGPLQAGNGMMSNTSEETCQILSQQYNRVFSQSTPAKIVLEPAKFFKVHTQHHLTLVNIPFTKTDVQEAISELKINSAAGPDSVPSILLLRGKEALALLPGHWHYTINIKRGHHLPNPQRGR